MLAHETKSRIKSVYCSECGQRYDHFKLLTFAVCCGKPLLVDYDLSGKPSRLMLNGRPNTMWRYQEFLPVFSQENIVTLGEGFTPLIEISAQAAEFGFNEVRVKDEALNPTASFKARGLSMAISKAREFGIKACVIPTAGNAGGALAAYCAKAGMEATVVMPKWTPAIFVQECRIFDAKVILVDGLINDCGKVAAEISRTTGAFDISTLKEPYRIEGKKTMGYEIAEQYNWQLPEVIIYPAGGGTGLIGIWKAFQEMKQLGWISGKLPRMVAVQSANCQPLVKAYDVQNGSQNSYSTPKPSLANGLAVPTPFGLDLMLRVIQESMGCALAVTEEDIIAAVHFLARKQGLLLSPEGAATWQAMIQLKKDGFLSGDENILLLNTGSGYKYLEHFAN
jgi:threonine synthase